MIGVEAIRQRDRIFDSLGIDDEVFARPTGSGKLFTGRIIHRDNFATALAPARYDPATLVVVAPPRALGREWRLVVADDWVIAGSQYCVEGSKCVRPGFPDNVGKFAEVMLAEVLWRPDPIFMLDICESDGRLWLLEINGFIWSWQLRLRLGGRAQRSKRNRRRALEAGDGRRCRMSRRWISALAIVQLLAAIAFGVTPRRQSSGGPESLGLGHCGPADHGQRKDIDLRPLGWCPE